MLLMLPNKCQRYLAMPSNVRHNEVDWRRSLPLTESYEFEHIIVCTGCFFKWSEAKLTRDKSAPTVAPFLL